MSSSEANAGKLHSFLERRFELSKHGTNVKTELIAGTATFLAVAAMPAVTPAILGDAGMDPTAVFWSTTLAIIFMSLMYALWINYPFVGGPSIGVSPWVAYYLVLQVGVPWQMALMCTFISGVLFILLSAVGFREKILGAIPMGLKYAFGAGIGAFISTVGLINTGIIKGDPTSLFGTSLGDLTNISTFLSIVTIFIIGYFLARGKQGGFLIGIALFTIVGLFVVDPVTGSKITQYPGGSLVSLTNPIKALSPTLFKISFAGAGDVFANPIMGVGIIIFTTFFIDVFDTIGTVSGLATLAGYIDEDGNVPKVRKIFMTDALGTIIGSLLGVTLTTTYVDSSVGIAEGGKTGLTSLWTAFLFILTLAFAPLFTMIPAGASNAAITIIGALMIKSVLNVKLDDFTEAFPAFLTIFMMPYTGNMGVGILCGIFSYTLLKTFKGKEKVNPTLWVLSAVFVVYIFTQKVI